MTKPLKPSNSGPSDAAMPRRRGFLLGTGAAGVAGAAALAGAGALPGAASVPVAASPNAESGQGYHLSEHVRQYYRSTRV